MIRQLLQRTPDVLRYPLMRRLFRFDPDRCDAIEVGFARTADEYRRAFALVYESYEAIGYFDGGNNAAARDARALFYPQVALSTSTVVIARIGNTVVGTASLIRDSAMGLAADVQLGAQKSRIAGRGERLAEFSMLAVAPSHRQGGAVMFALLRYIGLLAMERERLDLKVSVTHASLADALIGLILFEPITAPFRHHRMGTTFRGLYLDLRDVEARGRAAYRGAPSHRNLAKFFFERGRARVRFPDTPWPTTLLPKLGPEDFARAFGSREALHESLTPLQLQALRNAFSPAMRAALTDWIPPGQWSDRPTRYDALLSGVLSTGGSGAPPIAVRVEQVSAEGMLVASETRLSIGDAITVTIDLGAGRTPTVSGRVVHERGGRLYGVSISRPDAIWTAYVSFLESWVWGGATAAPSTPNSASACD